jgi:hypothetical protein
MIAPVVVSGMVRVATWTIAPVVGWMKRVRVAMWMIEPAGVWERVRVATWMIAPVVGWMKKVQVAMWTIAPAGVLIPGAVSSA